MHPDLSTSCAPSRIVLVGFMGAGKSTIGPILATRLGWRFVDADRHFEKKTGATIADFFSNHGETEFRRVEAEVVAQLHAERELVLALGGGAIESESTRRLLFNSPDTRVVFLKAQLEVLLDRCERQPDASIRPLLNQRDALAQRFVARQRHYETAHITVETTSLPPLAVAELVLDKLQASSSSPSAPVEAGQITTEEIKAGQI